MRLSRAQTKGGRGQSNVASGSKITTQTIISRELDVALEESPNQGANETFRERQIFTPKTNTLGVKNTTSHLNISHSLGHYALREFGADDNQLPVP